MQDIATQFGTFLDNDNFEAVKKLLSHNCKYLIGDDILSGPENISHSYQQNMIEGRKKLDKLEWGKSSIEIISESEYYVHFTDYLTHKEKGHIFKCKQKLTINKKGQIIRIEHINEPGEQDKLDRYYKEVGLK